MALVPRRQVHLAFPPKWEPNWHPDVSFKHLFSFKTEMAGFPRALQKAIDFIESLNNDDDAKSILDGVDLDLRQDVVRVLCQWGTDPRVSLRQIVSKRSLQHEIEECLPALQHLNEWRRMQSSSGTFVAVDVCGGKGIFSLLLQELASNPESSWKNKNNGGAVLQNIILIELANNIDWTHLQQYDNNNNSTSSCAVPIEIWRQCNVNEIDTVVERLLSSVTAPMVLTGIHLCGTLSLSFLSIVNILGPNQCPSFCLVPCCMPKEVLRNKTIGDEIRTAVIQVCRHEDSITRRIRIDDDQRRLILRRKLSKETPDGKTMYPCWSCGRFGHLKIDCPDPLPKQRLEPPTTCLDVSHILRDPSPCRAYCELLLGSVDGNWRYRRLWETGIISKESSKQLDSNWNRNRKSIYLVVSDVH